MGNVGEKNNYWKGGRYIAKSGYVMIWLPLGHHLRNKSGYAYEHRVVMEKKIGRKLEPGEIIHHKDHNKQNNEPENLELTQSTREHLFRHRKTISNKRGLTEENIMIECSCGCGEQLLKYDKGNRPRMFISGHNPHEFSTKEQIKEALKSNELTVKEIIEQIGKPSSSVKTILSRLVKENLITRISQGKYAPIGAPKRNNPVINCACGCGDTLTKYDKHWRERKFIHNHYRTKKGVY